MGFFGNNDSEQKSFEQTIERLKKEYALIEEESKAKDVEIERLKKLIETMQPASPNNEDVVEPAPEVKVEETPAAEQMPDYAPAFAALAASIQELKAQTEEFKVLLGHRDTQDENMRAMHKEMERYKGDFFAKVTQPYLIALLDLHRRFYDTYSHFDQLDNADCDMAELYGNLMKEFKSAIEALSNRVYNDFGIDYFEPKEGDEFDPKSQQPMGVVETENCDLHRRIAKTLYGGFRNIETDKVVRHARVMCYKFVGVITE